MVGFLYLLTSKLYIIGFNVSSVLVILFLGNNGTGFQSSRFGFCLDLGRCPGLV